MPKSKQPNTFYKNDIPASVVVFLVALPLCLGIALASGAPLFSGLISGIIGGIIVGTLSGSALGVSGPAAGLAIVVYQAITTLGSFNLFLVSVVIAGILQVIMGYLRAGSIAHHFPDSVIDGMLTGIGIIIILKQIPTITASTGASIVSAISILILIIWETESFKKSSLTKIAQGPLIAVIMGIILHHLFSDNPLLKISPQDMVNIPITDSVFSFFNLFTFPDFSGLLSPQVYTTAIVLAIIASLETVLSLEAIDKQDPQKRVSPANQELKAQGIGNIISGLIGGLPISQVVVRSSANQQSGAQTKLSTILHGLLLLISVITIPHLLNQIPLGVLAAILIMVGGKLAKPSIFINFYKQGLGQFIPFLVTIIGVVYEDILIGIGLGIVVSLIINRK